MEPDFYIGWQDQSPPSFKKTTRRFVLTLAVLVPILAVLLVLQQRGFSTAVFEYGKLTTLDGQLIRQPVPFLRILVKDSTTNAPRFERVLLIGLGKHGADSTLNQWEKKHGSLTGKTLKIRGTLIYHEGHAALELTEEADALLAVSTPTTPKSAPNLATESLGEVTLQGEITDPKCFLGVMKPGNGRPHKSCAVRCISGGIPPLLWIRNGAGHEQGYLLVGPSGEHINQQIMKDIGRDVRIKGRLEQADNWLILYIDAPVEVIVAQRQPTRLDEQQAIALCH
jgi:hypothetical protein